MEAAFGVPGLGLKRGLSDDVVVAPYAAILALPIAPRAVAENLAVFSAEGAEGPFYRGDDATQVTGQILESRALIRGRLAALRELVCSSSSSSACRWCNSS